MASCIESVDSHSDELSRPLRELSVANILRTVAPKIMAKLKPYARSVFQQLNLCRTPPLGTHRYGCQGCQRTIKLYNSCGNRNCPLCHGGQRDQWIKINAPRLVPQTAYLQIVFTLPDKLSKLILANRGVLYRLLMTTVWDELERIMRQLGIQPSAMLVLHTWNQLLKHHPHIHAIIPLEGISLDGTKWVSIADDPQFKAGINWKLSKRFRQTFCRRLNLFNQRGRLNLPGNLAFLKPTQTHFSKNYVSPMQQWLEPIAPHGFRVFVQPPPQFDVKPQTSTSTSTSTQTSTSTTQTRTCPAECLLNYLTRYCGGVPISDSRLKRWEHGMITFLARSREEEEEDRQLMLFSIEQPNNSTPATKHQELRTKHSAVTGINLPLSVTKSKTEVTISEEEFVRRLAIHVLPKGFMRVQHYGATSRRKGTEYLSQCRKMLGIEEPNANAEADKNSNAEGDSKSITDDTEDVRFELVNKSEPEEKPYEPTWKCTKCGKQMDCIEFQHRPSWKIVFERLNHQADRDAQLQLWTANELHELRNTKTSPAILDSS